MKAVASHTVDGAPIRHGTVLPLAGSFAPGRRLLARFVGQPAADHCRRPSDRIEHDPIRGGDISVRSVIRRRGGWRGMAAEAVGERRHGRLEFRFRAPVHLLVAMEEALGRMALRSSKGCRVVARHVDGCLAERLSLGTLAALVRLNPYHCYRHDDVSQSGGRDPVGVSAVHGLNPTSTPKI